MPTQVERRALQRAMEFHGGAEGLARLLQTSPAQIERWSEGSEPVPPRVFMKVVDLVIEHDLAELRRSIPGHVSTEPPVRVRFRGKARTNPFSSAAWTPIAHPFFAPAFAPKNKQELLSAALDAAMKVAGTDLANIQLLDRSGKLRIEAQHGFSRPFLDFFRVVESAAHSACGVALREQRQVFVADVRRDPLFAGTVSGSMLLEAGVQAVASSPIVEESGTVVGMLSTHYRAPTPADAANLDGQAHLAERVGNWLKAEVGRPG
jgi:hypothetical protein